MLRVQCTADKKRFTRKTQSTFGNKGGPEVWFGIYRWNIYCIHFINEEASSCQLY